MKKEMLCLAQIPQRTRRKHRAVEQKQRSRRKLRQNLPQRKTLQPTWNLKSRKMRRLQRKLQRNPKLWVQSKQEMKNQKSLMCLWLSTNQMPLCSLKTRRSLNQELKQSETVFTFMLQAWHGLFLISLMCFHLS